METAGVLLHIGDLRGVPVPITLFLYGAANVVVLSFVPAALFSDERREPRSLSASPTARRVNVAGWRHLHLVAWAAGVLWLALALLDRLLPAHASGRVGARLDPRLGAWPACLVILGFTILGLAVGPDAPPWLVALILALYTLLTLFGMVAFGRQEWLGRCEGLTALFAAISRVAPVQATGDGDGRLREVRLRSWDSAIIDGRTVGWDRVMPVVLLLGALLFQGLLDTSAWPALSGIAITLAPGRAAGILVRALGLLLVVLVVLLAFIGVAWLTRALVGLHGNDRSTAAALALMTLPIALLLSLALGCGAVLGLLPVRSDVVWYVQVTLLMLGHTWAVYLVNRWATARFRSVRTAMLAQYPMVVLLVACTMAGMLILAQPQVSIQ